jgi:NAD(P)-dependent dehydrogenase (short-subunit alcohol dehydrogenase family)
MYRHAWLIGSGGIGGSLCLSLQRLCQYVSLIDRQKPRFEHYTNSVSFWSADAANEQQLLSIAPKITEQFGPPDVLVIAAGTVSNKILEQTSAEEIDDLYHNNFRLVALSLKIFRHYCVESSHISKAIVIVASNAGLVSRPQQPIYAAMKAAVISLSRSLARSWGSLNIKINIIAPGTVYVDRNAMSIKSRLPNFPNDPNRPLGKIAFPNDLNRSLEFLLDPDSLITGQILAIDGGSSL